MPGMGNTGKVEQGVGSIQPLFHCSANLPKIPEASKTFPFGVLTSEEPTELGQGLLPGLDEWDTST